MNNMVVVHQWGDRNAC